MFDFLVLLCCLPLQRGGTKRFCFFLSNCCIYIMYFFQFSFVSWIARSVPVVSGTMEAHCIAYSAYGRTSMIWWVHACSPNPEPVIRYTRKLLRLSQGCFLLYILLGFFGLPVTYFRFSVLRCLRVVILFNLLVLCCLPHLRRGTKHFSFFLSN